MEKLRYSNGWKEIWKEWNSLYDYYTTYLLERIYEKNN